MGVVPVHRPAAAGAVSRAGGDDPAHPHTRPHERDQVGPHPRPELGIHAAARPERRDAVPEQQLGPIDVADAGEHRLVHEQRTDGRAAAGDAPERRAAVGAGS
jgi:hypothetical protein